MQARSQAIDSLVDSGTLDTIGITSGDDIDRQLQGQLTDSQVDAQLAALKQEMLAPPDEAPRIAAASAPSQGQTPPPGAAAEAPVPSDGQSVVVRISGEDQYRLSVSERPQLEPLDEVLRKAIEQQDQAGYSKALSDLLSFVRAHGTKLPSDSLVPSDVVLPSEDMTLEEATKLLSDDGTVVQAGAQANS
ncbi:MAG: PspA-associated protein PspAA, partial [Candidatus Dormibacteria bacterium]